MEMASSMTKALFCLLAVKPPQYFSLANSTIYPYIVEGFREQNKQINVLKRIKRKKKWRL